MPEAVQESFPFAVTMLGVLGIVIVGITLMVSVRRKIDRRNDAMGTAREQIERVREQARNAARSGTIRAGTGDGAAEVELATRLASQLDVKAARLEILLAEAREVLQRMEAAAGPAARADHPGAPSRRAGAGGTGGAVGARGQAAGGTDPVLARVWALSDAGRDARAIARELDEPIGKVQLILSLRADSEAG